MLIQALVICFSFPQPSKGQRRERFRDNRKRLGPETCANIIFVYAVLGIHGIGKGLALKKIMKDAELQEQDEVFNNENATKSDIIAVGEKALVCL